MTGDAKAKADVVAFWRAIELFSPQKVPKVDRFDTHAPVEKVTAGTPLPWQDGHRLHGKPTRRGYSRQHVVYLGVYRIDDVWVAVDGILDPGAENFDPRPAGDCALAAIVVDGEGRYLPDTAIVSGLAWAAGRTHNPGPGSPAWLSGFGVAATRMQELVDDAQAVDEERGGRAQLGHTRLSTIRARTEALLGVTGLMTCMEIRVRSIEVKESEGVESTDFLNSFIAEDLDLVRAEVERGRFGAGLGRYLSENADLDVAGRVDVYADPAASLHGCRPSATPLGRWPGKPDRPLALGQQFAVNSIMSELGDGAGVFAVNGPPGTGKSTLLRDLVAAVVVERADSIAALMHPRDAFVATPHRWKTGDYTRVVQRWKPEFHGFEMVVASSNNGAVENISHEMPAAGQFDDDTFDEVDYFGDIATALLGDDAGPAWALTAARLGRKSYRTDFVNTLWFDEKASRGTRDGSPDPVRRRGIQSILKDLETTGPRRPWREGVADYAAARARVEDLLAQRQRAHDDLSEVVGLRRRLAALAAELGAAAEHLHRAEQAEHELRAPADRAHAGRTQVTAELEAHDRARPAWWKLLSKQARADRNRWRAHRQQLVDALAQWDTAYQTAWAPHQQSLHLLNDARARHERSRARVGMSPCG